MICGNVGEIKQYTKFQETVKEVATNPSIQNKDNADKALKELRDLFTKNIRKEIGKKEVNINS